jgi:hypothetical protein
MGAAAGPHQVPSGMAQAPMEVQASMEAQAPIEAQVFTEAEAPMEVGPGAGGPPR